MLILIFGVYHELLSNPWVNSLLPRVITRSKEPIYKSNSESHVVLIVFNHFYWWSVPEKLISKKDLKHKSKEALMEDVYLIKDDPFFQPIVD